MKREFERLSRGLIDVIDEVKDEASLLKITCRILKADGVILIEFDSGPDKERQIASLYPETELELFKSEPALLWDWIGDSWNPNLGKELLIENSICLGNDLVTGGLIVFGPKGLSGKGRQLAMVAFRKGRETSRTPDFLSYHTWVASNLLKRYESKQLAQDAQVAEKKMDEESQQKIFYWQYANENIVPFEIWESLKNRTKSIQSEDEQALHHGVWIFFQIFRSLNPAKMNSSEKPKPDCSHAFSQYTQEGQWSEQRPVLGRIIEEVLNGVLHKRKLDIIKIDKLVEKAELLSGMGSEENLSPLRDQFTCQLLCCLWLNVMFQARGPIKSKKRQSGGDTNDSIREACFSPNKTKDISALSEDAKELKKLTGKILHAFLRSPLFKKKETQGQNWGREALRLYLAVELSFNSPRIDQLYLEAENTLEHRQAPEQLRRHFIQNYARFMISVLMLCLKQRGLPLRREFRIISASEELDSLLYLVDRYAHMEVGVDRRLNIRETLSRQVLAEVHLHLVSPYYRDHLLHVVDVFLLGHLLLNTQVYWVDREEHSMVKHLSRTQAKDKIFLMRNWAVASLLHDIGYQLEQKGSTPWDPSICRAYFALATEDGPQKIALPGDVNSEKDCENFIKNLYKAISNLKIWDDQSLPPFQKDHGIFSALRISQVLIHAGNHHTKDEEPFDTEVIEAYLPAIYAVACHNLPQIKIAMNDAPLAVLLRLCDELQEWGRRRVNVEKVIKGLYLNIQEDARAELPGYGLLNNFYANIIVSKPPEGEKHSPIKLKLWVAEDRKRPQFRFQLCYKDAVSAQFDPTMILLAKSFNFQHLDLSIDSQQNALRMMVELKFPVPAAYNNILEYDIYGLFTEKARDLPLLESKSNIQESPSGLVKLLEQNNESIQERLKEECFGIVLEQKSESRLGWLCVNPEHYRDRFTEFKMKILSQLSLN